MDNRTIVDLPNHRTRWDRNKAKWHRKLMWTTFRKTGNHVTVTNEKRYWVSPRPTQLRDRMARDPFHLEESQSHGHRNPFRAEGYDIVNEGRMILPDIDLDQFQRCVARKPPLKRRKHQPVAFNETIVGDDRFSNVGATMPASFPKHSPLAWWSTGWNWSKRR